MKKPIILLSIILFLFNGTHVIGMQKQKNPVKKLQQIMKRKKICSNAKKQIAERACSNLLEKNPDLIKQVESGSVNSKKLNTLFNQEIKRIYKRRRQSKECIACTDGCITCLDTGKTVCLCTIFLALAAYWIILPYCCD